MDPSQVRSDIVSYTLKFGGSELSQEYALTFLEIETGLNKIPTAYLELVDGNTAKNEFALGSSKGIKMGADIEIWMGYDSETKKMFSGEVVQVGVKAKGGSHSMFMVNATHKQGLTLSSSLKDRHFMDMKDSEAMNKIISEANVSGSIDATSVNHKLLVQHGSTDWDFIASRARANGLIMNTEDGKVVVKKPDFSTSPAVKLTFGMNIYKLDLHIDARTQVKKVKTKAWDPKSQAIVEAQSSEPSVESSGSYSGTQLSNSMSSPEIVLHSESKLSQAELKAWADAELLRSRMSRVRGSVTFQGSTSVVPGSLIEIEGINADFNGKFYVTSVKQTCEDASWQTEAFVGLPFKEEDKPKSAAPDLIPPTKGLYIGKVLKIDQDPDGEFRVQIKLPTVTDNSEYWARYSHPYASKDFGFFFYPQVDDEVLVGFLSDDPRSPVILGSLYSSSIKAPLTPNDKNSIQAIITKNKLKLTFDDENKDIFIETPGGQKFTLSDKDKKIVLEDSNANKITMDNSGITIKSQKDIILDAGGKVEISALNDIALKSKTANIDINATMNVTTKGVNIENKAQAQFTANANAMLEIKTSGMMTIKGSMVMIN